MHGASPLARAAGLLALLALASQACGRNHDLGAGGSSGAGGSGGAATTSSSSSSSSSSTSGAGGADAGEPEPTGPTTLTIVNGVVDYPAVRLCFAADGEPWPASAAGLAFAASQVPSPLSSVIPAGTDVTIWALAGDLASTAGKGCAELLASANGADAGAPALVARQLAAVPAVVWAAQKSLLLVPNGCLGGPGHDDAAAAQACGAGYSSTSPTAGLTFVALSRKVDPGHVSLQMVSASAALPEVDVKVLPALTDAQPVDVATGLTPGAVGPVPPFHQLALNQYGPLADAQVQLFQKGSSAAPSTTKLGEVFANGGVKEAGFLDGAGLALVAVGAGPGVQTAKFWRALTYTMVLANPGG